MKLFLLIIFAQFLIAFARSKSKTFEGDIDLRGKPIQAYVKRYERGKTRVFGSFIQRNAIKGEIYRWNDGVIPYKISDDFDSRDRVIIQAAIDEFHKKTCIKWIQKRSMDKDYVSIENSDDGCLSPIGKQGGPQFLDLGNPCVTKGIIIHEMMHALGFFHEQSRTDRDKYVEIIWDNINKDDAKRNFDRFELDVFEVLGYPYDYGSIMHYGSSDFAKDVGLITIKPKDKSAKIGQRIELSITDAKKVNKLYKCSNFDISGAKEGGSSSGVSRGPVEPGSVTKQLRKDSEYSKKNEPGSVTKQLRKDSEYSKKNEPGSVTIQLKNHSKCSRKSSRKKEPGSVTKQMKNDSGYSKKNELRICHKLIEGFTIIGGNPVTITSAEDVYLCFTACLTSEQGCETVVFDHKTRACAQYAMSIPDSQMTKKAASGIIQLKSGSECSEIIDNGNCADTHSPENCDIWAKQGKCFSKKYATLLQLVCTKTCMHCGSCENIYEDKYCRFYKDNGFCSKFEEILSYRCMKTCNKCFI